MLWTQFGDKQKKLGYFIEKNSQMLEKYKSKINFIGHKKTLWKILQKLAFNVV